MLDLSGRGPAKPAPTLRKNMKSYLKFLSRNKLYTAIEFIGLAVSLAFVVLIGSYVVQQNQMAHEAPDWQRVFALGNDEYLGLTYWDKEELEMNIPELEVVTHMALLWQPVCMVDGESFAGVGGMATDPQFFEVFPEYRLLEGKLDDFDRKDAMLVSESFARRIGKDGESLIGKIIRCEEADRTIAGIFQDFGNAYFMPCDIITNISSTWAAGRSKAFNSIGGYTTWYRIRKDADRAAVDAKIMDLLHQNYDKTWTAERVSGWHTYRMDEAFFSPGKGGGLIREGNPQMLRLLTLVVFLLLLSAVFNYVNLSFALTGKRAKEMATRRLLGAERKKVRWKYIGESVAFTAAAFIVALVLAYLLLPMFNSLLGPGYAELADLIDGGVPGISVRFEMTPAYVLAYLLAILILGTICGLLPAWTASRYEPIDIIKGTLRRRNKMVFSRVFIVIQNVLAVFLIAMALLMELQMRHMLMRPMHAAVDNRYYIEYSAQNYDQMKLFKDKVEQLPFVTKAGVGRGIPGSINMTMGIKVDEERRVDMPLILCDSTYFELLGLEIEEDFGHPRAHSFWMSRSAYNAAAVSDTSVSFARRVEMNGARPEFIGGVVTDFPTGSASAKESNPNGGVIVTRPEEMHWAHCLLIGTTGEDPSYDEQIRQAYRAYRLEQFGVEDAAWVSSFIRDIYWNRLAPERRTMRLVELFTVLAVLISLLGMLAMSTYFADENTKQIAIRKVFGGDVTSETWRNVKQYMLLVGLACLVGIPLAVWAAGLYLERFAWRIDNYGWIFALAAFISVAIAFASVLWKTRKAAKTNPAVELKKE